MIRKKNKKGKQAKCLAQPKVKEANNMNTKGNRLEKQQQKLNKFYQPFL